MMTRVKNERPISEEAPIKRRFIRRRTEEVRNSWNAGERRRRAVIAQVMQLRLFGGLAPSAA